MNDEELADVQAGAGQCPGQRQAFPRRLQDCEDPLEPEKANDVPQHEPANLHDVDFMMKDSKRLADSFTRPPR